ncbi:YHYH protein [Parasphingorhabdus sp. NYA22]
MAMWNIQFNNAARVGLSGMLALAMAGCGGDSSSVTDTSIILPVTSTPTPSPTPSPTPTPTGTQESLDPANFIAAGLATTITTEACTLSGGTYTTCYRITTVGAPSDHGVGTFCPRNINDGGAGMWFESGTAYDLTGAFIRNLATFYNNSNWKLYDDATGDIFVTDTQAAFEGAARPNVAAQYQNHCVEGKMSYVGGGISRTYLIPVNPVPLASSTGSIGTSGVGIALNGITFDPPAPVAAIKAAYTIAAFDDCGGHINPVEGYHYHAATGCSTSVASSDGHSARIGYALDGYAMYALVDAAGAEPTGLDNCRGHSDDVRGYHYHVAGAGENMFIGCFAGEQGSVS